MKRLLPAIIGIFVISFIAFSFFRHSRNASAAVATHVVISEVQIAGATTTDEFVELYNPTGSNVDLSSWRLGRKSQPGNPQTDLVSSISGVVKSHGYFLIGSDSYTGSITPDVVYASASSSIASNNSITLYNGSSSEIDTLGLGTSTASETATIGNPTANKSVERKANSTSNTASMAIGGGDEFAGNGEDTDNNSVDFVTRNTPQPQNSQSAVEPVGVTPSVSPTASPSPTSSVTPTPSPTPTPTPTLTPAPTAVPSVSPTPTPAPNVIFNSPHLICTLNHRFIKFFNFQIPIPFVRCFRV